MSRDESRNNAMLHAKASGIVRDNVSGSAFIPATQVQLRKIIMQQDCRDPMGPGVRRKKSKKDMCLQKTLENLCVKLSGNTGSERNMSLAHRP
jgi:hypothetical protein